VEEVQDLAAPDALLRAAIAIAMHEMEQVEPAAVVRRIDRLAEVVRSRVVSGQGRAYLAHLHEVLFVEEGFHGHDPGGFDTAFSYLPAVLETKRGLPITLALLYKSVADRLGLDVRGINAPGHFLLSVDSGRDRMIVDPYGGGRVLSRDEAFDRMERAVGTPVQRMSALLLEASPRQWLARILRNLEAIFVQRQRQLDLRAMLELRAHLMARR
jgi:regulator of sirC expression with transglutaminase-like and TPR domain